MATVVNMNSLLNGKDSRWLQLEVCREFQRNKCSRADTECKFAHPPANVEVQSGKVTACYDSIKGRCNRDKPPCKYFHPPQHLKDQLLINGRNHLALKNALMQQMGIAPGQPVIPGQVPTVATNPYLTGIPANTYSPFYAPGHLVPALLPDPSAVATQMGAVVPQAVQVAQQKIPRSDRLEMDVKTVGSFYYENFAFSGMVPYKRPAAEKSGIPVYQPGATTYQQLMQLQQPFVPVSYDKVEVCDQRVAVCRDHANGQCRRKQCKYYHIPIMLPPANVMAAIITNNSNNNNNNNINNNNNHIYKNNNNINNDNNHTLQQQQQQQQHYEHELQQQQQQMSISGGGKITTSPMGTVVTTTANYNNNLIVIEPQHQQQQQQQVQLHYTTTNTNNNNTSYVQQYHSNHMPKATIITTSCAAVTPPPPQSHHQQQHHHHHHHHQQQQQQQHYQHHQPQYHHLPQFHHYQQQPTAIATYNCHSPYSPSSASASSSSSCSKATSPTLNPNQHLTLATNCTLSTTSTATMPTPIVAMTAPTTATFLKATPTPPATAITTYYDVTMAPAPHTPTLVFTTSTGTPGSNVNSVVGLDNDYNANCIPILAATGGPSPQAGTTFIFPATPNTKYAPAQHFHYSAPLGHHPLQQHHTILAAPTLTTIGAALSSPSTSPSTSSAASSSSAGI